MAVCGPLLLVGWPALAMPADKPIALLALIFAQDALSFALGSTLITRVLYEGNKSPHYGWLLMRLPRSTSAPP